MSTIRFNHIIYVVLLMLGVSACSSGDSFYPAPLGPDSGVTVDPMVNLTFSVAAHSSVGNGGTRGTDGMNLQSRGIQNGTVVVKPDDSNYFEAPADSLEMIHSLRVVIVRDSVIPNNDPTLVRTISLVEHNKLFVLSTAGVVYYDDMSFRVRGDELKHIYIIANEESVCSVNPDVDFSSIKEKSIYQNYIEKVQIRVPESNGNSILFDNVNAPDGDKIFIPMCEVHDVKVKLPTTPQEHFQDAGTLFITRAAVKFSFNVSAVYGHGLALSSLSVNGVADREYFLPNNTVYNPVKSSIDAVVSNWAGAPDPDLSGRFITSFSAPVDATVSPLTFTFEKLIPLKNPNTFSFAPALYFCETRINRPQDPQHPFSISATIVTVDDNGEPVLDDNGEPEVSVLGPLTLPNLPLLPRNTHVLCNILFNGPDVSAVVDLVPYIGVTLEPSFGF